MIKLARLLAVTLLVLAVQVLSAQITLPPSGGNQKSVVTQYIGSVAQVTITYNSPGVRDRQGQIWGQLVPWGLAPNNFGTAAEMPWRAGANENTTFEFSQDVNIQGKPLAAGTYGFHVIPQENGPWTLIFSHNSTAWGSFFYNQAEDALRVEATPEKADFHEWLSYEFIDRQPASATVALIWENLKLPFKVEVSGENELYIAQIRKELQNSPGFSWMNWVSAASYCSQNNTNLEEALTWADNAVNAPFIGQENFTTLSTKAHILRQLGKTAEANETMEKAVRHPTANANQIHQYGRQLITSGMKEKALEIFKFNFEKEKGAWPTEVGMARGLSAVGQYDKALEHAKKALEQAPDQLNKDSMAQAIEKLKQKKDIN
ncbi:MAG TPA: DUF2911 domain-containing protein [Flavilitoribacter sp.]|nr:DUF2911 domain-containing protein [Flavilitoribacter sp.]HMQ86054.1 DUF2911 domain-containing protein [Flavilitoribacter sp.]